MQEKKYSIEEIDKALKSIGAVILKSEINDNKICIVGFDLSELSNEAIEKANRINNENQN